MEAAETPSVITRSLTKLALFQVEDRKQVVVINKIDLADVRELLPDMIEEIKRVAGHTHAS